MAREEKKFPAELYLDILKWLNFDQLIKIKPSTCYLKVFINDYKLKLARKKFREIYISSTSEFKKLPKPKANFYDFQLSKELEKKWKHGIEESIPVFLNAYNEKDFPICFVEDYRDSTTG
uniref:F-box domain-containing protein n=1 Tax=Meloidogyne incognita TaxID=6306 RepID=A0A914NDF8_MELIC